MKITIKKIQTKITSFDLKATGAKLIIMLALFLVPTMAFATTQTDLNQVYQQINALNGQIAQTKAAGNTLANQVAVYNDQINQMQLQINATQDQVNITNDQIAQTTTAIAKAESDIKTARSQLSDIIMTSYENGQQSQLEVIAKSSTFSEFVDQAQYTETLQLKIKQTADQVIALKAQLDQKQKDLSSKKSQLNDLKNQQVGAQNQIASQRAEQQNLLNQTNGSEAAYQQSLKSKKALAVQMQQAIDDAGRAGGGGTYGIGNVPQYYQTNYSQIINGSGDTIHDFGCGVTSLAMLLTSYGYGQSPVDVANNYRYFSSYGADSISWTNISWATGSRFHMVGNPYAVDMSTANDWASSGKPFIVWVHNAFGFSGSNHFVVIVGGSPGNWRMNDPVRGGNLPFYSYYGSGDKYIVQTDFVTP